MDDFVFYAVMSSPLLPLLAAPFVFVSVPTGRGRARVMRAGLFVLGLAAVGVLCAFVAAAGGTWLACAVSGGTQCGIAGLFLGAPVGLAIGSVAYLTYWRVHTKTHAIAATAP